MPAELARPNRRRYYRVSFPAFVRPIFHFGGRVALVLDCSEVGIRILLPQGRDYQPRVGDEICGHLRLHDQHDHVVCGEVVRVEGSIVAICLYDLGLPFATILAEQRFLRRVRAPAL